MNEVEDILDSYRDGVITQGEALNRLCGPVTRDNVERARARLPTRILEVAKRYNLGVTPRDFKGRRWHRLWECLFECDGYPIDLASYLEEAFSLALEKGQRFRAEWFLHVTVVTSWKAPFSHDFEAMLPAGEELITVTEVYKGDSNVHCVPINYDQIQERLVPEEYRTDKYYNGYRIRMSLADVEERCQLL